jgi:hypothetical protein
VSGELSQPFVEVAVNSAVVVVVVAAVPWRHAWRTYVLRP